MNSPDDFHSLRSRRFSSGFEPADPNRRRPPVETGAEAVFLQEAVQSERELTVALKTGERLVGRIRYQDHDCFSVGLSDNGLNVLLRKADVLYIAG